MSNKIILGVIAILLIGGGAFWAINSSSNKNAQNNYEGKSEQDQSAGAMVGENNSASSTDSMGDGMGQTSQAAFTMEDVAKHNSADSCYTAINGSVYDVTSFIYKHPGGAENILAICGKDGTSAFDMQHEGNMRVEDLLATFKIGTLVTQ